jgi:hypothetical protein
MPRLLRKLSVATLMASAAVSASGHSTQGLSTQSEILRFAQNDMAGGFAEISRLQLYVIYAVSNQANEYAGH